MKDYKKNIYTTIMAIGDAVCPKFLKVKSKTKNNKYADPNRTVQKDYIWNDSEVFVKSH